MLAVSAAVSVESFQPNPNHNNNNNVDIKFHVDEDGFMTDFSDGNDTLLLESIDFDDLFVGFDHHHGDDHGGGDVLLPDLVMDPEILTDFSSPQVAVVKTTATTTTTTPDSKKGGDPETGSTVDSPSSSSVVLNPPDGRGSNNGRGGEKGKKSTSSATSTSSAHSNKNTHGKRKVKVDWTPKLHRRFVQAVEQLGVDKAVPSRILELMGIDCLTRHNVASHLQKYRSHRKHILAREAEAASWTHRRQVYAAAGGKRDIINHHRRHHHHHHSPSWHPPTIGFPPPSATVATPAPPPPPPPMHPHPHGHLVRPLHVWGHPSSMDVQAHHPIHIWPKHQDPSFWHHHHHHQRVAAAAAGVGLTPGTPCFPHPILPPPPTRFTTPPVQGIPSPTGHSQPGSNPNHLLDLQPSKESIDAAIGDVLSKPWLPLPLGLKPPAVDSVVVELQRQGIPNIPPAATCSS